MYLDFHRDQRAYSGAFGHEISSEAFCKVTRFFSIFFVEDKNIVCNNGLVVRARKDKTSVKIQTMFTIIKVIIKKKF